MSALDADDADDADDAPDDDSLLALELDAEFPQPNSPRAITPATSKLSTFFFIIILINLMIRQSYIRNLNAGTAIYIVPGNQT